MFLQEQRLLSRPIPHLHRHILAHRAEYYRLLLDVPRAAVWEPWVSYMLGSSAESVGRIGVFLKEAWVG